MNAQPQFQLRSSDLPVGNTFTRLLTARVLAKIMGETPVEIALRLWPSDRVTTAIVERAAVVPASTTVTGWAAELVQRLVVDTLASLGPVSAAAQLMRAGTVLMFDGRGLISIPGFIATANDAAWVAEGAPIPVQQFAVTPGTLNPHKIASIAVLTAEMIASSNAERMIGDTLIRAAGLALDAVMFDANPATPERPAGLRSGIATATPNPNADPYEAMIGDISGLVAASGAVGGPGPYAVVVNPGRMVSLGMRFIGLADNVRMFGTPTVGNDIVVVALNALASIISANPDIETSKAASLHMDDAPAAIGTASPARSLFQTDSVAIKVRWPASWTIRDPRAVAWTTPTWA